MKKLFTKITAAALSALIAAASYGTIPIFAAADKEAEVTIHFDLSEEGVKVEDNQYGNPQYIYDISGEPGKSRILSDLNLEKSGYTFSGWTFNGVQAYEPGDVIQFPDADATLTPVWSKNSDSVKYTVHYEAVCDTGTIDKDGRLPDTKHKAGELVEIPLDVFDHPEYSYSQIGWIYDGIGYLGQQKIIMPSHNIELTPNWMRYCKFTYSVGDVDRVPGVIEQHLERIAGLPTNLAEASRFLRIGFRNTGWLCSVDGKIYPPEYSYIMPDEDVVFTAVWEPVTYTIVFRPNPENKENLINIDAQTDTTIICPEINITRPGYKFGGWNYNGTIYQPGDEFFVYGELAGLGILLEAVWIEESSPELTDPVYGDANCDGSISLSDAVLIMQAIGNPDKYGLGGLDPSAITAQGMLNADCNFPGDGITNSDALAVQKYCLHLTELPITEITE